MKVYRLTQKVFLIGFFVILFSCQRNRTEKQVNSEKDLPKINTLSLVILGTVQDAGSPHITCNKDCCKDLFENPDKNRKVVSLSIIDPQTQEKFLFEATPDITEQMKALKQLCDWEAPETPDAIFLTHAHIGHYAGLMYLGKEAMNAKTIPVYAMPKMKSFLENHGPWSQLVNNNNILIHELQNDSTIQLNANIQVIPHQVPHRDEYSETVGYTIMSPNKKVLFIPDIDKWVKWDKNIIDEIQQVDYAFLDATFYDGNEINTRNISEIPHPFVVESMSLFSDLSDEEKRKIHFIHFNHTNPLLNKDSKETKQVIENGFNIAHIHDVFEL